MFWDLGTKRFLESFCSIFLLYFSALFCFPLFFEIRDQEVFNNSSIQTLTPESQTQ